MIDKIWHLKPLKFEYMNEWKSNQEKSMQFKSGSSLKDENLSNFLRMLNVSITHPN
jgi:D-glycerate 3-kinase